MDDEEGCELWVVQMDGGCNASEVLGGYVGATVVFPGFPTTWRPGYSTAQCGGVDGGCAVWVEETDTAHLREGTGQGKAQL